MRTGYDDDLRLAHVMADQVDAVTMSRFRALDLQIETKPDDSPVTDADRLAEDTVRSQLARTRPRDAIVGEERGATGHGARQWVIDPIDGTKNFIRGLPVWATLIGLVAEGEVVAGLVSAPALGRRWWAAVGSGAWAGKSLTGASRIQVSQVSQLADASLSYASLAAWEKHGLLAGMLDLQRRVWRSRAYGDFWSYCLLAEGCVDVAAEPELALHDMAALVPIVTEAGGTFTDLEGNPGPFGGSAVVSNGLLHNELLQVLHSPQMSAKPAPGRDSHCPTQAVPSTDW